MPAGLMAQDKDCSVGFYIGDVEVRFAGTNKWKPVEMGMNLRSGDVIRTLVESRVELMMSDGTRVDVDEKSIFEVIEVDGKSQRRSFKLLTGKIAANVKKLTKSRAEFRMESPVAIAAIRGTKFTMIVNQDLSTKVSVSEGKIEVKLIKTQQTIAVGENQQITIDKDSKFELNVIKQEEGKDETPPKLDMEKPKGGEIFEEKDIEIKGEVEPGAKLKINGAEVKPEANGKFELKVELAKEGINQLNITATDSAGNEIELILEVMLNTSKPEVKLTSSAGDSVSVEVTDIIVEVTDATPDDIIKAKLNGEDITLTDGKYSETVRLKDGENKFKVEVEDMAGHKAEAELEVVRKGKAVKDTEVPTVTAKSAAGSWDRESYALSIEASDNYPIGEVIVTVVLKNSAGENEIVKQNLSIGTFEYDIFGIVDGKNEIIITVVDKAGNSASTSITLEGNVTAPQVTITSAGGEVTSAAYQLTATVTDKENDVFTAKIVVRNADGDDDTYDDVEVSSGKVTYSLNLTKGENTITLVVSDKSLSGDGQIVVTLKSLDNTPPSLTLISSVNSQCTNEKTLVLTGSAEDQNDKGNVVENGVNKLKIKHNGEDVDVELSGGPNQFSFRVQILLEEGDNKIEATVTDLDGNASSQSVDLALDTRAPTITVTRPGGGFAVLNLPGPPDDYDGDKTFTVLGYILDIEPSCGIEFFTINGKNVTIEDDGTFEFDLEVKGGTNSEEALSMIVQDLAKNITQNFDVTVKFEFNK